MIAVDQVHVRYGPRAILQGVSFAAQPGEFIAILGNNGAGKTTLLDVLAGLRTPDSGTVTLAGKTDWSPIERARLVSHLPQAIDADLPFTAGQIVAMGRYPHAGPRDRWFESPADHAAIEAAMHRTGCFHHRTRRFATLSGGERQRVLLAASLAQQAAILLLDEPSTFLDIAAQLECFTLLRDQAAQGRLCLAVTHDLNLALTFCTRLLVLEQGIIARDLLTTAIPPDPTWLQSFSPALRLGATESGKPWVWYA